MTISTIATDKYLMLHVFQCEPDNPCNVMSNVHYRSYLTVVGPLLNSVRVFSVGPAVY